MFRVRPLTILPNLAKVKMKTVAVIGLGPAGLTNVKELKAAGFDVLGIDRSCRVGGRWALDNTINAGVWRELCMNATRRHLEFSDFPWPDDNALEGRDKAYKTLYPHCSEAMAYLESYAKHFDLYPNLQLQTDVKQIKFEGEKWILTFQSRVSGNEEIQEFDSLVVCTGQHAKPFHPLQHQFQGFTGTLLHSRDFRTAKDYKGQRVLVIGSGVSGGDIAAILATEGDCQSVTNSVRRVPYHVTKFSQTSEGVPLEVPLINRLPCWLGRVLPDELRAKGLQNKVLAHFPDQLSSTRAWEAPDSDIRAAGVSYTVNYLECFENGAISLKPATTGAKGKTVSFVDGTEAEFDVIICATGYEPDLSYLPGDVLKNVMWLNEQTGKSEVVLYKHTLVPSIESIAFGGLVEGIGSLFVSAEIQARYIASVFKGTTQRPSIAQLHRDIEKTKEKRRRHKFNAHVLSADVGEQLGDELGITPTFWEALMQPQVHLFSPLYSCYYRSKSILGQDSDVARKCRERFLHYIANPEIMHTL